MSHGPCGRAGADLAGVAVIKVALISMTANVNVCVWSWFVRVPSLFAISSSLRFRQCITAWWRETELRRPPPAAGGKQELVIGFQQIKLTVRNHLPRQEMDWDWPRGKRVRRPASAES